MKIKKKKTKIVEQTDFQNLAQYLKKLVFYIWIDTCEKSHKTIWNSVKNLSLFFCTMSLQMKEKMGLNYFVEVASSENVSFIPLSPPPLLIRPLPSPLVWYPHLISHFTGPSLTSYLSRKNHQKISCMTATEASDWKSFLQNLLKPVWLGSKEKQSSCWKSHSKHEHFLTIPTKLQKSVIFFCIYQVILESLKSLFWWMNLIFPFEDISQFLTHKR